MKGKKSGERERDEWGKDWMAELRNGIVRLSGKVYGWVANAWRGEGKGGERDGGWMDGLIDAWESK